MEIIRDKEKKEYIDFLLRKDLGRDGLEIGKRNKEKVQNTGKGA